MRHNSGDCGDLNVLRLDLSLSDVELEHIVTELCKPYGPVARVVIDRVKDVRSGRNYARVYMLDESAARTAAKAFHGTEFYSLALIELMPIADAPAADGSGPGGRQSIPLLALDLTLSDERLRSSVAARCRRIAEPLSVTIIRSAPNHPETVALIAMPTAELAKAVANEVGGTAFFCCARAVLANSPTAISQNQDASSGDVPDAGGGDKKATPAVHRTEIPMYGHVLNRLPRSNRNQPFAAAR